jgi:TonB-linked SusC/RagA family outer membrane protein
VVDSTGTIPLPGVTVKVDGAATGSQTDAKGKFSLNASPDAILVFTYIGYNRKVVAVGGRTNLYVPLSATNEKLNEVVVVGYGQQKKVSVTGAVAAVGPKELKQSSSANIANALAGRLPGLTSIQSAGGQPGRDDATMYLRGAGTINGKSPLILIDDVPRDNLRTIDPNEVASISILKDASATAVYGVRGANGVILITTRRGQPGRAELNVTADQSFSAFTREPERLHSLEYMALRNEASANDGITPLPFPKEVMDKYANPLAGLDPKDPDYAQKAKVREYMYPDHDYYREFAKRLAPQTRVNMNLSGGTDKVSYFANAGFLHQGGNIKTESPSQLGYNPTFKMDRYSFRTNLDYRITSSLKAFLNIGSYIEKVNMPSAGTYPGSSTDWMMSDIIYQAQTILPITPGPTTIAGFGVPEGKIVDPGYLDRSAFEVVNRQGYRKEVRSNLNSTLGLQWDLSSLITRGLSLKGMISYDSRATTAMQGYKTEQLYLANINYASDDLSYTLKRANDGRISLAKGADSRYNINMQGSILYNRTFGGKHAVGGLILAQRDYWETTAGEIPYNVIGLSGRATYAYDNRYLVEFNFGYNGSEQFAPTKRFGFFPAVSAGWVVSNEAFLKGSNVVTNLKLRASYGKVGNDKMGGSRFLYLSDITVGGGPLPSLGGGINQGLLANPMITWETAKKQNYGIDLELFGGLGITFDYFLENRSNILASRGTVPQLQGVPLDNIPKLNLGAVDNKGFEIELNYHKDITRDFQVMVKGNFGYNHNVVKFVDEPINSDKYAYRYRTTGYPIGQSWGYKIDYSNGNGYFNSKEELDKFLSHTTYGFGTPRVGDFIYKDLNGDGVIDDKDLAPIKYSSIPGIIYGAGLNLGYKAFEFSIFFQGVGQYSSNYANQGVYENIKLGTYFDYHKHAWTAERYAKGEKITYPALSTVTTTNHQANDFFIMDRSFVRLKNLELAYNIPPSLLKQAAIKGIRVYVSGQNLFTWDKLKMGHLDPETNNSIGYTVTKMFSFGLNATF